MATASQKKRKFDLAWAKGFIRVAGVDEAGRGPLAGPVVACACILPPKAYPGIDDSKKLSREERIALFEKLSQDPLVTFAIAQVDAQKIDEINILQATYLAMQEAVAKLNPPPDCLLVDGPTVPCFTMPAKPIVGGDGLSSSIGAASIIAKETRDRLMEQYHLRWPHYGFDQHKGYGTLAHFLALRTHGHCPLHRLSFLKKFLAQEVAPSS